MNFPRSPSRPRGFALIMVMLIVMALAVVAGGFAFSMKVETRLAANQKSDAEMQWMGRSGVELARFVLSESFRQKKPTALNQIWAGGPGDLTETNGPLMAVTLKNNRLGSGTFSVRIIDQERKANINRADRTVLNRALEVIGLSATDSATLIDSLEDWRDLDDDPRLSGSESEYYLTQNPPYYAKNGPLDDITELLLVNGVTPELFWGPQAAAHLDQLYRPRARLDMEGAVTSLLPVGLVDLFTALSSGSININTASVHVLQLLPGVDEVVAQNIIRARAGPDGVDGTEDDVPFQSLAMLSPAIVPGITPELLAEIQQLRIADVRSITFQVIVDVQIGRIKRQYSALIGIRGTSADVLFFSWR